MTQKRRNKRNISGWIVLDKPAPRCQQKWEPVLRFGSAAQETNGET